MVTDDSEAMVYRPLEPVNFSSQLRQASGSVEKKRGSFIQRRSLNRNFLLKANTFVSVKVN